MTLTPVTLTRTLSRLGPIPLIAAILSIAIALFTAEYGYRGDEGFAVYSFTHPEAVFIGIISQWLAVPLAKLIPLGPVAYRMLPTLLIVPSNLVFALGATRLLAQAGCAVPGWLVAGFALAGSLNPVSGTDFILSLSYYHFAWAGSSLALGAVLASRTTQSVGDRLAWLALAALGLAVVFFGRPPGAAATGLFAIAVMAALDGGRRSRLLAETLFLGLLSMLIAAGLMLAFGDVRLYADSISMTLAYGENSSPLYHLRTQTVALINIVRHGLAGAFALPMVALLAAAGAVCLRRFRYPALIALLPALAICVAGSYLFPMLRDQPVPPQQVIVTCLAAAILLLGLDAGDDPPELRRALRVLTLVGLGLPLVSQVGSAGPIVYLFRDQMGPMAVVLLLAGLRAVVALPPWAGRAVAALLILAVILPAALVVHGRLDYLRAKLTRDGAPYPTLPLADLAGLRAASPGVLSDLTALRAFLDSHQITPASHRVIGFYDLEGAIFASGLKPFGHIALSDYYEKLACAYLHRDTRLPGQAFVVMANRDPGPVIAGCLAGPEIGFPARYTRLGSVPWNAETITVYLETTPPTAETSP